MTAPRGRRNATLSSPWHYCARCDKKKLINSELTWQRGKLLCEECLDRMLIGGREVEIAHVLSDGKQELAPVPKLRDPELQQVEDDLFI